MCAFSFPLYFWDQNQESELLALLRNKEDPDDKLIETDISEEDLVRVMDRSDLVVPAGGGAPVGSSVLPLRGPGWEVVIPAQSGGMLSSLTTA